MADKKGFFESLFSQLKKAFIPPVEENKTEEIPEPRTKASESQILFLPKVNENDIILARKKGDPQIEVLIAHLVPIINARIIRDCSKDPQQHKKAILGFAQNKCFYFATEKSRNGKKWEEICIECYERVFELLPQQVERIPSIAKSLLSKFKDHEKVLGFIIECVLYNADLMDADIVNSAYSIFSSMGVDEKVFKDKLKSVKKTQKKMKFL